jgi:hypothetical protein
MGTLTEKRPSATATLVHYACIRAQKHFQPERNFAYLKLSRHPHAKAPMIGLYQKVKMVGHKTVSQYIHMGKKKRPDLRKKKNIVVCIRFEYFLSVVALVIDMVEPFWSV